jgi:DNA-binding response OmpR family regulator
LNNNKPKFLIVDDSRIIREETKYILESFGYQVDTAEGGGEAIRAILGTKYDLVLLDVEMPQIDGFQVFKRIRARNSLKILPIIIFFTESANKRLEGLHLGASDFIIKSLVKNNKDEFQARMEAHLKIGELISKQIEYEKKSILQAATTSACHEIFNPLTVVNIGIDFILKKFGEKESCQYCISMLQPAKGEMLRIQETVKKLSGNQNISTISYGGGGKMLDLENPNGGES